MKEDLLSKAKISKTPRRMGFKIRLVEDNMAVITELRKKKYTWGQVVDWLKKNGIVIGNVHVVRARYNELVKKK